MRNMTERLNTLVEAGVTIEPGDVVGYIFEAGEDIPDTLAGTPARRTACRRTGE